MTSVTNWWWLEPSSHMRRRLGLLVVAIAGVCVVSLSTRVAVWWGDVGHGGAWAVGPLGWLLSRRPDIGEADVHAFMWLVISSLAAWSMRSTRLRVLGLCLAWVLSATIEVAQAAFTTRSAEWSDLAGNSLGVAAAALLVGVITWPTRTRGASIRKTT